mgnify:CR=1 FL=1
MTATTTPTGISAGTTDSTSTAVFERRESDVRSYCRSWPVVFERALGAEQTTEDGTTYLDFFSGAGALNYGHNHPALKRALQDYLAQDTVVHAMDMFTPAKRDFLLALEELAPFDPREAPRG